MNSLALLNSQEKNAYNSILQAVTKNKNKIFVNGLIDGKSLQTVVKLVLGENSQFFFYDNCKICYTNIGINKLVLLSKWVDDLSHKSYVEKFEKESQRIVSQTVSYKMNSKQKALALHNYMVKNVRYCDEELNSGNYSPVFHTAYGAIVEKNAVCEGISAAYCYLLKKAGIDATIINGTIETLGKYPHCWNLIKIDSEYFHVDVTWDLKKKNNDDSCFDYFAVKDSDLVGRTWDKDIYPKCFSDKMNYFYLTKTIANTEKEFVCIAENQLVNNNRIYIKCPFLKMFKTENEACDYIFNIISSEPTLSNKFYGRATFSLNQDQNIIAVSFG